MPVSTIASAYGAAQGVNPESQKVINYINGHRTAEDMIGEYYGLVKEFRYEDGTTSVTAVANKEVKEYVNEFMDERVTQEKGVKFIPYFESKGMTLEMFNKAVKVTPATNGNTNESSTPEPKGEPALSNSSTRTPKGKK